MKYDLIIKNGKVVTAQGVFPWHIAVSGGKIARVMDVIPEEDTAESVIDAEGLHVFPGLIDAHCHFDEPGYEHREGIYTGSCTVAASGVTAFLDHPISNIPEMTNAAALEEKRRAEEKHAVIDYAILGGVNDDNIDEIKGMDEWGAIAFKAFMSKSPMGYIQDRALLRALDRISELGSVMLLHAENEDICSYLREKFTAEGRTTLADYEASRPILSETESVRRAAAFAQITGARVQICHASCRETVEAVREAKARGVRITVETCPHYLALSIQDMLCLGGCTCSPPMRPQRCIDELWEAVRDGDIDTIGSDHSAWPISETVFGGLSVGQSTLSVLLTEGYHKRGIPLETIARLTSMNPAKLYDLYPQKGDIAVGFDADFAIVDLNEEFVLKKEDMLDRQKFSPYLGRSFKGAVKRTISRGETVYENGKITAQPGRGKMLLPLGARR